MLRSVGLPRAALTGDLDRLYAERMVHFVRESSLDSDLGSGVSPGSSPVLVPPLRLVVNEASSIACASFADACASAQTWVPVR